MDQYHPQYPYPYSQSISGPPQPQWQAPPRRQGGGGWGDPRPAQHQPQSTASAQSPVSPYNPSAFGYQPPPPPPPPPTITPAPYGDKPIPAYQYDSSTWGVKYNHAQAQGQGGHQQLEPNSRPPLPPRPASADPNSRPDQAAPASYWQLGAAPSSHSPSASLQYGQQRPTAWADPYHSQPPDVPPPPPPPRPAEYQNQNNSQSQSQNQTQYQQSIFPHEQYSHHPPSHKYEPHQQPQSQAQPASSHYYSTLGRPGTSSTGDTALVSPIEPESHIWPNPQSAHQHYGDGNVPAHMPPSPPSKPPGSQFYSSALGPGAPSDWEHFDESRTASPVIVSPPQSHANLANVRIEMHEPAPSTPPQSHEMTLPKWEDSPSRIGRDESESSLTTTESLKRTGTIDSVINAWSSPLRMSSGGGKSESEENARPLSQGSVSSSRIPPPPPPPTSIPTPVPTAAPVATPTPERIVEVVTKTIDPYDDLEPEFKGSLKRYAAMLRKESVAETDEEKFALFQAFMGKELRLRSMLYGVEMPPEIMQRKPSTARSNQESSRSQESNVITRSDASTVPTVVVPPPVSVPSATTKTTTEKTVKRGPSPPPSSMQEKLHTQPIDLAASREEDSHHSPPPPPPTPAEPTKSTTQVVQRLPAAQSPATAAAAPEIAKMSIAIIPSAGGDPVAVPDRSTPPPRINTAINEIQQPQKTSDFSILKDQSNVTNNENHEDDEEAEYSPGGRPRVAKRATLPTKALPAAAAEPQTPNSAAIQRAQTSPSTYAPMVLEDYAMLNPPSPGGNAPMLVEHATNIPNVPRIIPPTSPPPLFNSSGPAAAPLSAGVSPISPARSEQRPISTTVLKFEPPRPAYTPFRYNPSINPVPSPSQPADQSYSSLRKEAFDSGRLLVHEPALTPPPPPSRIQTQTPESLQPAARRRQSSLETGGPRNNALLAPLRPASAAPTGGDSSAFVPAATSPAVSKARDEAFIGLIRQQSKAVRGRNSKTNLSALVDIPALRPGTPRAPTPFTRTTQTPQLPGTMTTAKTTSTQGGANGYEQDEDRLNQAVLALRSLLPSTVPPATAISTPASTSGTYAQTTRLKARIDAFPDNFAFIHSTVVEWDRANRDVRRSQDTARNARQAENEAHIDGLFHDNEIGYGDIGALEEGFKLAEAETRYQEDVSELESFSREVYGPVTGRLKGEVSELEGLYHSAVALLDSAESEAVSLSILSPAHSSSSSTGATLTTIATPRATAELEMMSFVMGGVLTIFQKLEVRHQKLAEADVERERRRKRLELTVLYTNGDTAGVKKLERDFAVAEKMQVLLEARNRDGRANKLMDAFDRATVRGLGDNQTFVDDLLVRIRGVRDLILQDDTARLQQPPDDLYGPQGPRETLELARQASDLLLADSQRLLTLSNVADKILNDADYAVSVAQARVSTADGIEFQKLETEKSKEDTKIIEDTNSRMHSIARGPEEAIALIREVVDRIGDDAEHQDRIKKALEAAKQRNAVVGVA